MHFTVFFAALEILMNRFVIRAVVITVLKVAVDFVMVGAVILAAFMTVMIRMMVRAVEAGIRSSAIIVVMSSAMMSVGHYRHG